MVALNGVIFFAAVIFILETTDGATTYIDSPGYPAPYKPTNDWRTQAPVKALGGMRAKLTVTMMDLADGDTVDIYDGSDCSANNNHLGTFKGTGGTNPNINKVFFSTTNTFCIKLRAPTGYGRGFTMKTEDVYGCQGTYTEDNGDIISPGFPNHNYETSTSCRWTVSIDQGQRIEYKVMSIDFDPGSSCPTYLTLSAVQTDHAGKICQSSMQGKTIVSTSTDSDVVFESRKTTFWNLWTTNEDSGHKGFWLAYKSIGCKAKLLPASSDTDGHLSNKNEYYANSYIAKYACNPGYWFSDKKNENWFVCQENEPKKQWYGTTKQCVEIRCGNPPVPAGGQVSLSNEDKMNSVATYTCNTDFTMNGKDKRTCLADGTWSDKTPNCKGVHVECSVPGDPPNGKQIGKNHSKGDSVSFECDMGYELEGHRNITCLQDGKWSANKPVCKEITCRPPMPPHNGFLVTNATTLGSTAIFKCLSGYKINGSQAIVCLPSGTWSGVEPVCELITCPGLSDPYDGKMVLSGLTPGNSATFSCSLGFNLIGPETMNCTAEGSWSSPPPFCSKVYCPDLQNATNAQPMSSVHIYLDVAVYRCDPDYFFDSNRSTTEVNVTCQADGVWSENVTGCWYGPIVTTPTPTTTITTTATTTPTPTTTTTTTATTTKIMTTTSTTTTPATTTSNSKTMRPATTTMFATSTGETGPTNADAQHSKQDAGKQNNNIYIYIAVGIVVVALVVCITGYVIYSRRKRSRERSPSKTKLELPDHEPSTGTFENPLFSPELHAPPTDRKSKTWLENPTYNTADDVTVDDVIDDGDIYDRPSNIRVDTIDDVDE
ncbi:sushi, von Willebrand factor type A, EGF and pentraxin domain-containing protein 1-like [Lineus longissimus]|uniref:sushi, von Willebrand factor type A, EGF and pentraxin domain-containing protein 1-like n=1 Tax=Lineus longissimus TaxID=88925 RepID=UPI002B4F1515